MMGDKPTIQSLKAGREQLRAQIRRSLPRAWVLPRETSTKFGTLFRLFCARLCFRVWELTGVDRFWWWGHDLLDGFSLDRGPSRGRMEP